MSYGEKIDVNKTKLSAFPVPLCSRDEMKEASSLLMDKILVIDRTLDSVEQQLSRAEKNKQSILAAAFSGEIVDGQ